MADQISEEETPSTPQQSENIFLKLMDDRIVYSLGVGVICSYLLVIMEWLYAATKPSFMSNISTWNVFTILLSAALPPILMFALPAALLRVIETLRPNSTLAKPARWASYLINAFLLTITSLLILDNFSYNVFKYGVATTSLVGRIIYIALFITTFILYALWLKKQEERMGDQQKRKLKIRVLILLAIPVLTTIVHGVFGVWFVVKKENPFPKVVVQKDKLPNIVYLISDALDSEFLSVYEYETRNNTPYLKSRKDDALIADNAFPNAPMSTASDVSVLSGRYPIDSKLQHWPDALLGQTSREHMPAILRDLGYELHYHGARYFADPYDINMINGFQVSGFRTDIAQRPQGVVRAIWGEEMSVFFYAVADRAISRIEHLIGFRNLSYDLNEISGEAATKQDLVRKKMVLDTILEAPEPFYVHLHSLSTHGPVYAPLEERFAKDYPAESPSLELNQNMEPQVISAQSKGRADALRDDTIFEFDQFVKQVYETLESRGIEDNTIVVVASDHTSTHNVRNRIPLIILFPNSEHAGIIKHNTQLIDVPVTLLDYLGTEHPVWMSGRSLISDSLEQDYPVFSTWADKSKAPSEYESADSPVRRFIAPPFYDYSELVGVIGQNVYTYYIETGEIKNEIIESHTSPLSEEELPTEEEVRLLLLNEVERHNLPNHLIKDVP